MKKMSKKQLTAILIALSTILASFAAINLRQVHSQPTASLIIDPNSQSVEPHTTFYVDVRIEGLDPIFPLDAFDILVRYDPTAMAANSATQGPLVPPGDVFASNVAIPGEVWLQNMPPNGIVTSDLGGVAATIEFICLKIATNCPIYFDPGSQLWHSGGPIPWDAFPGIIDQEYPYWEPLKLQHIVEWPGIFRYWDIPFPWPPMTAPGYMEIMAELEAKGYMFEYTINPETATAMAVEGSIEEETFSGTVTSLWSHNTLDDGTRACMLSAEMDDGTSMAMAFATNLLPPEQIPEVDPYIIVNAQPYIFVRFYWYAWPSDIHPLGRIITWPYWWYDSHSHPNWFWGPYWWWRCYTKGYFLGMPYPPFDYNWAYWRPWWGWWWHWVYCRHWYWWSSYFPYDP